MLAVGVTVVMRLGDRVLHLIAEAIASAVASDLYIEAICTDILHFRARISVIPAA